MNSDVRRPLVVEVHARPKVVQAACVRFKFNLFASLCARWLMIMITCNLVICQIDLAKDLDDREETLIIKPFVLLQRSGLRLQPSARVKA